MAELSERQERILAFLRDFIEEKDYPPTVRDIQEGCGISSTSVVDYNLKRLEEKGYLRRDREISRGIELVGRRRRVDTVDVPLYGQIAAGEPIPVITSDRFGMDVDEWVTVTGDLVGSRGAVYALRVKGQSMIEDLIDDGDIIIVEPLEGQPREGEQVAVWLEDRQETTFKRIYREPDGRVRLQPANQAMEPIYARPEDVRVQGRLVSVIRGARK